MNPAPWTGITICREAVCWVPTRSAPHPSVKECRSRPIGWTGRAEQPFWRLCGGTACTAVGVCWLHMCGPTTYMRSWNPMFGPKKARPEKIMNEFKSYASRELNRLDRDGPDRKRWARHGSTRWLWKDEDLQQALQYVVEEQGEPMTLFIAER